MIEVVIGALVGGGLNRIRGGWLGISGGDWIVGGVYGLVLYLAGYEWHIVALSAVALAVSFTLGWGRYLGTLGGIRGSYNGQGFITYNRDALKENWLIDPLIAWAKFNPRLWGFMGCFMRGAVIGAALCIALGPIGLLAAPAFPLAYFIGTSLEQVLLKRHGGFEFGEIAYGGILGIVIALNLW